MKSIRKLTLETLLQTLDYEILRSGDPTQIEREDLMNKMYFYYFIFLFILRASSKEFIEIPYIKISLFASFFF